MIFILLLALYAFSTRHIAVTHYLTISGPRARLFGFLVLVLFFPSRWLFAALVGFAPVAWLKDGVTFTILSGVFLLLWVGTLAMLCRDPMEPRERLP
jgi:hypothetical protein